MDSSMDFEWTRLQGKTQSGLTGPSSDHTIGDTTGFYLYIEASPPRNEGDKARLVTPSITSSSEMVLTFYSHMYGATMGTLNVYRRTGSNDNLIMSLNGDRGDIWNLETAVLDPGSFSLVFEAMRGSDWSSDLAIDDITVTASPKGRADIAFVVDGSGSVGAGNFEKMKSFVRDVTNDLTIGSDAVQVAFVLFSDSSAVEFGLNAFTDKESLASAINQVIYKGGATNIASGLRSLRQDIFVASMGDRATAPNVGILLSDGPSNWDAESTVPEAQEARATGIELFAVGVGPDADKDEMLQITNSEERVMAVSNFDTLSTMKNSIIGSTRNDENECVSSPCRNGGVCLDRLNTFVCECSSGFSGDTCEQNCVSQADVIFAIDTSGSIAVRDFRKILTFVGKVSKQLQVGQNARIGLVTFSSTAKVEFHLNEHMDVRSVLSSLDKVKYRYGATNTQAALKMMQNDMFTTDNGDRAAPNVVILVTDGISTVEQENTLPNAESLKLTGAHIFVIGVGSFVDVDELSGIASSPSESNMILVTDFDALDTVVMTVAEPICTGQNSCSSSPCQNGGQCFNKVNGYTCSCPSDKGGLSCEVDCPRNIDLAFLIDESGSIGLDNFRKVMDFVMAIAKNVATGSRIGVVTFSDNAAEEFNMVKHGDKQQILDGIEAIKYSGGATHTAAGLQMLRESTFQTNNGNRNGVPDVAIVITDGISTVNEVNTGTQASLLKSIGVEVWSIGIGQIDKERQNELSEVATSDSTIKTVSDFESLQGLVNEIVSTLCSS
ncbi:unnamed protein product [Owenia fusiformis]|uniref:Uncharacterized protein n=1 Tax=Owenia fusiformis TaxID=6347 RepID=A0A8J1TUS8_OWEFU|nr:unnamed protein product [Owenia fusiformis]